MGQITLNEDGPLKVLRNVKVGPNTRIFNFVNAYGCTIGDESRIGSFVEIQKNVVIGRRCKISSHSFICEGVSIGDGVFIGHNVNFINDKWPAATTPDGELKTEADWTCTPTSIGDYASIGTGAIILCGVKIGARALVGAGSVVTKDVPDGATVAGNPARLRAATERAEVVQL